MESFNKYIWLEYKFAYSERILALKPGYNPK